MKFFNLNIPLSFQHFKKNFFFFWPYLSAYEILVPQPGNEPGTLAVKAQTPNCWTTFYFLTPKKKTIVSVKIVML